MGNPETQVTDDFVLPPLGQGGEQILTTLTQPVLVLNQSGRIVYANAAAEDFFRLSSSSLIGQEVRNFVPFGSPILALIDQVRRRGGSVSEYGVDLGTPRTGHQLVDIQVARLADEDGGENSAGLMITLQARNIATTMDRQLIHRGAARSVTAMAAVLAHEIKNPLSGIKGAAQLLELDASDDGQELTRLIVDEVDRIAKIVDRMEVFTNQQPIDREAVNIHEVLDHVRKVAEAGVASHVEFGDDFDPSLPPVMGERDQLIQVFLNLVKNAAEAVPKDGGEIILSTAYRHGVRIAVPGTQDRLSLPLEVCVTDNGPGVPDELKEHLFDPFVTTKPKGQGLGLALVAKMVGDHGGVIECDSEKGRTTFRVLLPFHNGPGS